MKHTPADANITARVFFELLIHVFAIALVKALAWAWNFFEHVLLS
jgi:hypothetical protein